RERAGPPSARTPGRSGAAARAAGTATSPGRPVRVSGFRANVDPGWDVVAWRAAARRAWAAGLAPEQVDWNGDAQGGLLPWPGLDEAPAAEAVAPLTVPPAFLELAARVLCHREPQRHAPPYRMWWRSARV